MSKKEKLLERLQSRPRDFTYDELATLLLGLGYSQSSSGRTSGSATKFTNSKTLSIINLHRPHPSNIIKMYIIDAVIAELEKGGYMN